MRVMLPITRKTVVLLMMVTMIISLCHAAHWPGIVGFVLAAVTACQCLYVDAPNREQQQ